MRRDIGICSAEPDHELYSTRQSLPVAEFLTSLAGTLGKIRQLLACPKGSTPAADYYRGQLERIRHIHEIGQR